MARLLAQTLTLARPAPTSLRGLSTKVEVIEIDLSEEDAAASPSSQSSSVEVVGIRRLEEAIHGVMVRRATPDWLPFVPGGSFWVPPVRRPHGSPSSWAGSRRRAARMGSSEVAPSRWSSSTLP
ncbi:hypothetical protein PR202_ga27669 [Eleusine coracana subsp. coracana]|uniref:Uncharacterized protein n=1 Tax=Eleusine coracana subsp. coracana TaxID=191504 RepID=A0AAV5DF45_ELECO|nr:hypothetical protein PR202_ga27669 [Eleusine coracana subsp. coracana]